MRLSMPCYFFGMLVVPFVCNAGDFDLAATATNQLAVDLHRQLATGDENLCVSPYSIESALAMTFAGAEGETRTEMARVLHLPNDGAVPTSFSALQRSLEEMSAKTADLVKESKRFGGPSEPITLSIANRLFAQKGYNFREAFLSLVKQNYGAAFEPLDFVTDLAAATQHVNKWVADETRDRIRDLIPAGALNNMTRLVLANALYIKAPWADPFSDKTTHPEPFHVHGGAPVDVPMMRKTAEFGYVKRDGFTAVSLPYVGDDLQFLVLLPDDVNGLDALESKLTANVLAECAKLEARDVDLHLPKFKLEPPTIALAKRFQTLGMKSAFDQPRGSADFDRMAPRKPNDYLYISQIFHKTFIAVDEKGTEAAAATAVVMMKATAIAGPKPQPIEVKVDHPFIYAIQHVPSGVCLFLGRVTDPR
ncbi:MAG: serpin family protein [Verrucomicrobia bacterium]|nr:MAG: serpin family protein [Verrucomicrobiota bacterium]PYJ94772.1 MAG: serpin family protein [Verrucomicrobiota bacterium]PYK34744.1 MAG: serpin family protein [Verrucomicrobiota bacterium]PYL20240.1 MAG: serpin family protein [Verrucomicrobiota bacterium]PYL83130.1 MAG: serpin family protein [Verrucomicrobiota bacterium]